MEAIKNAPDDATRQQLQQEFEAAAVKLKGREASLADFAKQTGLRRDRYREQVFSVPTENGLRGFGKSVSGKAVASAKKSVAKYEQLHYNKDGSVVITDNWIGRELHKIPDKYRPFAVVETLEIKGEHYQHNLTYYNKDGLLSRQVHGGHHGQPRNHKFTPTGEHQHIYKYDSNGKIAWRKTKKLTKKERKEVKHIL